MDCYKKIKSYFVKFNLVIGGVRIRRSKKKGEVTRAVHRSVRVEFVLNPESTCWNQVEKKGTCRQPTGVIRSGSLEHQRVAGGSDRFGTARKRWKKHRFGENLTRFDEISPYLVKIWLDLREIVPEFGKNQRNLCFFTGFWRILAGI